jgi:lauroyl/myristoyl acyltransferase
MTPPILKLEYLLTEREALIGFLSFHQNRLSLLTSPHVGVFELLNMIITQAEMRAFAAGRQMHDDEYYHNTFEDYRDGDGAQE